MSRNEAFDIELINRIKAGDTLAFKDLVNAYKDVSLTLACSVLKDNDLAQDAVQTAFIKVYEKLNAFRQDSKFSTWLYRIVINTAYNLLKKQKNHQQIDVLSNLSVETDGKSETKALTEQEQKKFINLALNRIKADEALILRLFYLYEHTILEIREITGFSKSKIKVDLHRGRKNMELKLQKMLGNEIRQLL
ncbi:MAG: RNA polymerase sigma factor [Zunongwangia sp.]|uniref:RNA polymerase sigma-70 factor, ECF subfamily protein n=1 Tax=Zunongwangia profunda (strain DSM 18752 / CCTCC AB 206139 / SM-A87) TaxID=655815 RepID=D5BIX8_ZUNPS|nr:RNA polymerase sigma factor [Zunongwangia profunda]ADF53611.1 RNA polymerase sigma-70 factor, ECF subfamily protein [Zunongwangia profunda SM-A87]MAO35801.1 RNA polymerase sigma factor [Zunongwangia sp.]MAS71312.1 RNA polymerase sigma factor [Zunongwangia sp.]